MIRMLFYYVIDPFLLKNLFTCVYFFTLQPYQLYLIKYFFPKGKPVSDIIRIIAGNQMLESHDNRKCLSTRWSLIATTITATATATTTAAATTTDQHQQQQHRQ